MREGSSYDALVIGGGLYGSWLALHLKRSLGWKVTVLEREEELFQRASYANQARVHNGYHYPRSLLTGLRSRVNLPRFVDEFRDCIADDFEKYYAVARVSSNVTSRQFQNFCKRIDAPLEPAPRWIQNLFNPELIEDVFQVREYAFDAIKLKEVVLQKLRDADVEILLRAEARSIRALDDGRLELTYERGGEAHLTTAGRVFNCTYSRLNHLLQASQLSSISLKHELTEIALIEVPEPLRNLGITVVCGPFFSVMPFPPRGVHSLSHVRYTPHCWWVDPENGSYTDAYGRFRSLPKRTNFDFMVKDAERYLPCLRECRHVDSLWEIKTLLPKSEVDDSRPVLFQKCPELPTLISIMGAKIDNVYEMTEFVDTCLSD